MSGGEVVSNGRILELPPVMRGAFRVADDQEHSAQCVQECGMPKQSTS
jgi:hypothetical protein